ncbi:MAG: Rv2231c family pyridoxal phosphate-dependent protein CobC [Propionibacteriaceae bacterium]|nr:Rv2231c family pyridoxal phosphate-dependent protein CobC [Propionibacteriaceae bacterium]
MNLRHHGDADAAPGLVDLAVNVRRPTPRWLLDAITCDPSRWESYPDPTRAVDAIARHHGVRPDQVLPVPGAAAAFALIADALAPEHPVVVHPQFTEPESALVDAGIEVRRHLLPAPDFALDPGAVPDGDLVVIGNPTNPTGTLHPADAVLSLRRPGRTLVVDEAFMDFVPGETESVLDADLTGVLVVRSLTKMWGLPGLRAGFVIGDPVLIERLARRQRPWATSTPALDALVACSTPAARAEAEGVAHQTRSWRDSLCALLEQVGLPASGSPQAPFVLIDATRLGTSPRERLAERGWAVRRGETFPGLGPQWIRISVPSPDTAAAFAAVLGTLR